MEVSTSSSLTDASGLEGSDPGMLDQIIMADYLYPIIRLVAALIVVYYASFSYR